MDPGTVSVIQTAIITGSALVVTVTVIGTRAWMRVAHNGALNRPKDDQSVRESVDALRQEVAVLKDTATRFDVSFDTALQRLEARVANLETRHVAPSEESESKQIVGRL